MENDKFRACSECGEGKVLSWKVAGGVEMKIHLFVSLSDQYWRRILYRSTAETERKRPRNGYIFDFMF